MASPAWMLAKAKVEAASRRFHPAQSGKMPLLLSLARLHW